MFNSFVLKAKSIFFVTLYAIFDLLDTIVFPLSIVALSIYTIVCGVKLFYALEKLANLPTFKTIIMNRNIFPFLMTLGSLSHSVKITLIQITMIHLFAIIASELALLLILASIVLIRGVVSNIRCTLSRITHFSEAQAKSASGLQFNSGINKSAGVGVKLMLSAFLFATVIAFAGSAHSASYLKGKDTALFPKDQKDGLIFKALIIGNINIPRFLKRK